MALTYKTKDGDRLDRIAKNYYGDLKGRVVEKLLEANARLAEYGAILPEGVLIVLPDKENDTASEGLVLWD